MANGIINTTTIMTKQQLSTDGAGIAWVGGRDGYRLIGAFILDVASWVETTICTATLNNNFAFAIKSVDAGTGTPIASAQNYYELYWTRI